MNKKITTLSKTLLLFFAISIISICYAEEDSNSKINAASGIEETEAGSLAEAGKFRIGNDPTIWIMIILANLVIIVTIEKAWVLKKTKGKKPHSELASYLSKKLVNTPNIQEIVAEIRPNYGVVGRIATSSLRGWFQGTNAIHEFADFAVATEKRFLEKRLVILSTLGNNIPFIGLLGTVLGIMKAFRDLSAMGESGPGAVMTGISEALIATAMGLAIAVPCVIAYNALSKAVKERLSQSDEVISLIKALRISVENNIMPHNETEEAYAKNNTETVNV